MATDGRYARVNRVFLRFLEGGLQWLRSPAMMLRESMGLYETEMGGAGREFPPTAWTRVLSARDPDDAVARTSLERLMRVYWKPVYCYVRAASRKPVEDCKDLTQAFFAAFLTRRAWERLDPERGSFRGFLKRSVRNFLIDADRRDRVRSPEGDRVVFRLDEVADAGDDPGGDEPPEGRFDLEWIQVVLEAAVRQLESHLADRGLQTDFAVFRAYCMPGMDPQKPPESWRGEGPAVTYADVGATLGIPEAEVRKRLHRARQALRQIVREAVQEYAASDGDLDDELRFVLGS